MNQPPVFNAPAPLAWTDTLPFVELDWLTRDAELKTAVRACVARMREAASTRIAAHPAADPAETLHHAATDTLNEILKTGRDVHGIAEDRHISTVIVFNSRRYPDGIFDQEAGRLRNRVDALVKARLPEMFDATDPLECIESGFLLYPPGSYMGWHTNARVPGWRLMLTWVDAPSTDTAPSFFRYRDPDTNSIVTANDAGFNARILNIRTEPPLWHVVYTTTWRYTLGYKISAVPRRSLLQRIKGRLAKL